MTIQINIQLPNDVFSALRTNPETFVQEMRLAAAVKWYEVSMLSQSKRMFEKSSCWYQKF